MRKLMTTMMVMLLAVTVATAQRGHGQRGNHLAELKLTTEQQEQIKAIREASRAQMQELRKQNPDQRPDREAMKKMREEGKSKIEAILTSEQREQLAAIKAERKAAVEAVDKKALKADLKAHTESRVKPVLSAARGQLDQFISAEDRAALDRLRPVFANKPKNKSGKRRGKGQARGKKPTEAEVAAHKAAVESWKEDHASEIAELKALTKKYATDLERIRERMAPQREQWAREKREIMERHLPEGTKKARGKKARKGKGKRADRRKEGKDKAERGDWPRGAAFLLMKG